MFDIEKTLAEYGLTSERYEELLKDCSDKVYKTTDMDWAEIASKYGIDWNGDSLRKAQQPPLLGGAFVKQYYDEKKAKEISSDDEEYLDKLRKEKEEIRKERIKLQTANIERNRLDRGESRHEMYYEYVGSVVETLPPPEFNPILGEVSTDINYLVGLADVHFGAKYKSINNEYSPEIAKERFEYLTGKLIEFIQEKQISKLSIVSLGDLIQGVLRLSDLKINDSSIVKATVEICRLIANMLNELSAYANIIYYHTPSANHTQLRVLNAKASELADEDLEYLMGNYIHDLCANNERITVRLAKEGEGFIEIYIPGNEIIAMHGHQIKNVENAIKDLTILHKKFYDTVLLGHYHNGKEVPSHEGILGDAEVLISPSFVGSDPYSDSICKGSKASVKIYGFNRLFGHTETYKVVLN